MLHIQISYIEHQESNNLTINKTRKAYLIQLSLATLYS